MESNLLDRLMTLDLDPIPEYLLQRDLLGMHGGEIASARRRLDESKWVKVLASSQWEDGSWGRFHTQDTKRKQLIPSSECAIRLALESGLDKTHPVLARVVEYIERVLRDEVDWLDWHEKHDNPDAWPWHVRTSA